MNLIPKYEIRIKSSAERDMKALPRTIFAKIADMILSLEHTPRPVGCKKLRGRIEYRLPIGKYRVLYIIDDKNQRIEIVAVGDRKDIYR